jgi:hypothetical protein
VLQSSVSSREVIASALRNDPSSRRYDLSDCRSEHFEQPTSTRLDRVAIRAEGGNLAGSASREHHRSHGHRTAVAGGQDSREG